jgi:uncharacterized membrane protein (DUF485 family)
MFEFETLNFEIFVICTYILLFWQNKNFLCHLICGKMWKNGVIITILLVLIDYIRTHVYI